MHDGSLLNTDEQLLSKMADDDRQAFTFLYRRYWEGLFINRRKELHIQGSVAALKEKTL